MVIGGRKGKKSRPSTFPARIADISTWSWRSVQIGDGGLRSPAVRFPVRPTSRQRKAETILLPSCFLCSAAGSARNRTCYNHFPVPLPSPLPPPPPHPRPSPNFWLDDAGKAGDVFCLNSKKCSLTKGQTKASICV